MSQTSLDSDNTPPEMATSRGSDTPASATVFSIPELLEPILLAIPIRELLLNQRVSKQWQATIKTSTRLQQALFFKPLPVEPLRHFGDPNHAPSRRRQSAPLHKLFRNPFLDILKKLDLLKGPYSVSKIQGQWVPSYLRMLVTQPALDFSDYNDRLGLHCVPHRGLRMADLNGGPEWYAFQMDYACPSVVLEEVEMGGEVRCAVKARQL